MMAGATAGFDEESETYRQECSYQTRTFTLHHVQYVRISLFIFQKLTDSDQKLWGAVLSRVGRSSNRTREIQRAF